jgi:hypothetical protein
MQLKLTYWQSGKYELTVSAEEVIPALRKYAQESQRPDAQRALADLEAGRVPADLGAIADALADDGQVVAGGAPPVEYDVPDDYTVEVLS